MFIAVAHSKNILRNDLKIFSSLFARAVCIILPILVDGEEQPDNILCLVSR